MKKLSGWQKVGLFAGIGCFSFVALLVVGFAGAVFYARSTIGDLGDTTPKRVERGIAIQSPTAEAPPPGARPASPGQPMRLTVDLQEGTFDIKPGQPNGRVEVTGEFSEALYELTERTENDGGSPRTVIRFRARAPMWKRMLAGLGDAQDNRPRLTLLIPPAVPIDLSLTVSLGESKIDLGGLTLSELGLDLSMGNHQVDFKAPLADGLRQLRLSARMGNVEVENLGNARAARVDASGSMGNLRADLGGEWRPGSEADVSFSQSMGEITVRVPRGVRLQAEVRDAEGKSQNVSTADEPDDPRTPVLKLRVSSSMGESRVSRY